MEVWVSLQYSTCSHLQVFPAARILQYWNNMSGLNITIQQFNSESLEYNLCVADLLPLCFETAREYDLFSDRNKRRAKPD